MDIKSKKCKGIISFVCLILGLSLLISSLLNGILTAIIERNKGYSIKDAFTFDYQETDAFRDSIASHLQNFLAMATGEELAYYAYEGAYHSWQRSMTGETSVAEESADVSVQSTSASETAVQQQEADTKAAQQENKRAAEEWHQYLKEDQNMLYVITYEGETVYTNTNLSSLDGPAKKLPKGYNFLLYFDGEKVSIIKDGKEVDVYGNGYYEEDSKWYVPGYSNFTTGEKEKSATVCIAAIKSPVISISKNNGSGFWQERNQFYMIEKRHEQINHIFVFTIVIFCFSLILLFLFFRLRKEKKTIDIFFARITGKVWVEPKVLLAGGLFVLCGFLFLSLYSNIFWYITDNMRSYIGTLSVFALWTAAIFLILYAAVNDLVHNKCVWRHSFIRYAGNILQSRGMQYAFQKRMLDRSKLLFLLQSAVVFLTAGGMYLVWIDNYYYTSRSSLSFLLGTCIFVLIVVLFIAAQIVCLKKDKETIVDMERLIKQIEAVHNGNMTENMQTAQDADLAKAAENLNEIQVGMHTALEEQIKSERMKVELISNVSHDVKTPLTSIISYVDLLKQETDLPDYIKDYVHILDSKSKRLKDMVQDVFEVSKAASGQLPVKIETLDFGKLLRQTLADMEERIQESGLTVKTDIPAEAVMIQADGQRLYRVFQNLIQNALKYSMDGTRIYITLEGGDRKAAASVKNISREELTDTLDVTERFVRGDKSRSDGGSGLGLSIAKSFTEACKGGFSIETIADLFVVKVEFNLVKEVPRFHGAETYVSPPLIDDSDN